jgi:hypothetical protein
MEKAMDCSDFRDDMMDVLYGEADAGTAARFEAHRSTCDACREELQSLEGVRLNLQAWEAPAARVPRRFLAPVWRGWAAAAAVALAFTSGLLVARTDVKVHDGALEVRFAPSSGPSSDVQAELARHKLEVQAQLAALKQSGPVRAVSLDESTILRQVEDRIRESEARQAVMLRTGLGELWQTSEARRREDIARISAGFSYLESRSAGDLARTNELMRNVIKINDDEK